MRIRHTRGRSRFFFALPDGNCTGSKRCSASSWRHWRNVAGEIQLYIDILSDKAGSLSAISSLQTLDATVKKNDASIKGLEKSYADAMTAANNAPKGGKGWAANIEAVKGAEDKLTAARQKQQLSLAKQDLYRKGLDKQVEGVRAAQAAESQRASQSKGLLGALESIKGSLGGMAEQAKGAGGPIGDVAGKLEGLGKGGTVGVAIAIAAALVAVAVAGAYAAWTLTKYAIVSADAARTSRAFSEAALGSAAAGNELEAVVDQMSDLAPGLSAKLKDVGRSLAEVNIRGRDAQRTLNAFGIVATARGEQAAGAIKSVAESSRVAGRLMLGPLNRITGEFDSLRGTGIKSADVFKALSTVTGKSADAFKNARTTGLVPFKDGLKAIELAAQMSLGGVVAKQMMSLSSQADKLKENLAKLFSGVNIETFLAGLKTVTDLFDSNTVTGYIMREVFTAVFTKVAALAALVFPYIVAGIKGVVFGVLIFAKVAQQAYTALSDLFSGGSKADNIILAFRIGAMAVGLVVGAVAGLALAFVVLGTVAALALAPIWVPFALAALAIYAAVKAVDAIVDAFSGLGDEIAGIDLAASAGKMIDGLIKGIKAKIADVKSAILEVSGAITSTFDSDQEIQSPGKKAMRKGKHVGEGYAIGGQQSVPMIESSGAKMSGAMTRGIDSGGGEGSGSTTNAPPTFSFSNCQFGSVTQATIEEMMNAAYMKMQRGFAGAT
jgi:hypothetical protein